MPDAFAPAIAYREAGDYARAESWLTEHLLAQPDDAQALAHLAHIQMLRKRDAAAHATLVHAEAIAPDDPLILRNRARLALRAQKIEVAASAAARALAADPAGLENRLVQAVVLGVQGETERALKVMDALLTERPDFAEALANRAVLHLRGRNAAAAMADAYRALEIKPHLSQPWRLLAIIHAQAMRTGDALSALRRYCELEPEDAVALAEFGELLRQRGLTEEALKILSRAIEIAPNLVSAWVNYGTALQQAKRADDAAMAYEKALALKPDLAEVHSNLGIALKEQGKLDEAVARYEQALACKPDFAEAHSNLGTVLKDQGKLDEAVACYRRALVLKPDFAEAHSNLGNALEDQGKLDEAVAAYRQAIGIKPDLAEAHSNLGNALKDQGKLDEAVAAYRQAIGIKPDYAEAHSNLLFSLNYGDKSTAYHLFAAHREWDERYGRQVSRPTAYANVREAARRLKIGYVSPDFRAHSVAYFVEPLLKGHDRQAVEVFCYAEVKRPDTVTAHLQGLADHWLATVGLSDEELAERIRADGIDILVDLAGHTANNRLRVFARKPAPVQVTWLGYPNTTGLEAIDYRLVDAVTDPFGEADAWASETLVRLEGGFLCYGAIERCA